MWEPNQQQLFALVVVRVLSVANTALDYLDYKKFCRHGRSACVQPRPSRRAEPKRSRSSILPSTHTQRRIHSSLLRSHPHPQCIKVRPYGVRPSFCGSGNGLHVSLITSGGRPTILSLPKRSRSSFVPHSERRIPWSLLRSQGSPVRRPTIILLHREWPPRVIQFGRRTSRRSKSPKRSIPLART